MSSATALLRRSVRSFVDEVLLHRGVPAEVEARIEEHALKETLRITRALMLVACTVGLAWWPFDLLLYRGQPDVIRVFALWRGGVIVCSFTYFVTSDRWAWARRHNTIWGTTIGGTMAFLVGVSLGAIGSVERAWFGSLYYVPVMSLPFLVRPLPRLAGTLLAASLALLGFFWMSPFGRNPVDAGTGVGLMAFGVAVSVFAGHAIYHLFRKSLLETFRSDEMSRTLAERVDERTSELRLLAAHIRRLHENEARALSHEMHDELGQLLTGMRMELDLAERVRERGGDVAAQHGKVVALLDATMESMRCILAHLRPRILDDFGLVAAVEWLVADTRRRSRLDVRLVAEPEDFEVAEHVAAGVFRIVQESLTNVLRHAGARAVRVSLRRDPSGLTATVEDDGRGLPPLDQRRPGAVGLIGMRERATALAGTLEIAHSTLGGARIRLHLPDERLRADAGDREVA
jgi:signal transduction histidine kinase